MASKGQVVVRIVGDAKDLERALGSAEGSLDKFGRSAEGVGDKLTRAGGKMTAFASIPIAAAMAGAGRAASNLEQSVGGVESVFGDAAGAIDDFGETAGATAGLSKRQVNEMAAVIGASLQGMGFEADEAAEQVVTLEQRAADMAATFGGSTEEAIQAVSSALRGERDPIEKYGVSMKEADVQARILALGLDTSTTAAAKKATAIATLDLVMGQTAATEGQFAREADGAAGSMATARAEMENAAAEIGEHLLPLAADLAGTVGDLASSFGDLPDPLQKAILAFAGLVALAGPLLTVGGNVIKLGKAAGDLGSKVPGLDRVEGSFGRLAKAGAALGAAAAALQAVDQWAKSSASNVPSVDKLTASLLDLSESGRLTGEVLDIAGDNFEDLGKKIRIAGNSPFSIFDSAGIREVQEANAQIDALDKSLASLLQRDPAQARALFDQITEAAVAQGTSVETVNDRFNDYTDALAAAEVEQRLAAETTGDLATATDDAAGAAKDEAAALDEQATAAAEADEKMGGLLDATLALFDADLAYAQQVNAVEDAIKGVTEATKGDNAEKLTATERTEAQERAVLEAETAILRQAAAAGEAAEKNAELAGKTLTAAEKSTIQRQELEKVRDTLDPDSPLRARIDGYITRLGEIPAKAETEVEAKVDDALTSLQKVQTALSGLMRNVRIRVTPDPEVGDAPASFSGVAIGGPAVSRVQSVLGQFAGARITSTYRDPARNRRVGGAATSLHMDALNPAVDIGGPTAVLDKLARKLAQMGGWRQLLWRVKGHYDHIHAAHQGEDITAGSPGWLPGLRPNERLRRVEVGESVLTAQQKRGRGGIHIENLYAAPGRSMAEELALAEALYGQGA